MSYFLEDVSYLIWCFLRESGFTEAAMYMDIEAGISQSGLAVALVQPPQGALLSIIRNWLDSKEAEAEVEMRLIDAVHPSMIGIKRQWAQKRRILGGGGGSERKMFRPDNSQEQQSEPQIRPLFSYDPMAYSCPPPFRDPWRPVRTSFFRNPSAVRKIPFSTRKSAEARAGSAKVPPPVKVPGQGAPTFPSNKQSAKGSEESKDSSAVKNIASAEESTTTSAEKSPNPTIVENMITSVKMPSQKMAKITDEGSGGALSAGKNTPAVATISLPIPSTKDIQEPKDTSTAKNPTPAKMSNEAPLTKEISNISDETPNGAPSTMKNVTTIAKVSPPIPSIKDVPKISTQEQKDTWTANSIPTPAKKSTEAPLIKEIRKTSDEVSSGAPITVENVATIAKVSPPIPSIKDVPKISTQEQKDTSTVNSIPTPAKKSTEAPLSKEISIISDEAPIKAKSVDRTAKESAEVPPIKEIPQISTQDSKGPSTSEEITTPSKTSNEASLSKESAEIPPQGSGALPFTLGNPEPPTEEIPLNSNISQPLGLAKASSNVKSTEIVAGIITRIMSAPEFSTIPYTIVDDGGPEIQFKIKHPQFPPPGLTNESSSSVQNPDIMAKNSENVLKDIPPTDDLNMGVSTTENDRTPQIPTKTSVPQRSRQVSTKAISSVKNPDILKKTSQNVPKDILPTDDFNKGVPTTENDRTPQIPTKTSVPQRSRQVPTKAISFVENPDILAETSQNVPKDIPPTDDLNKGVPTTENDRTPQLPTKTSVPQRSSQVSSSVKNTDTMAKGFDEVIWVTDIMSTEDYNVVVSALANGGTSEIILNPNFSGISPQVSTQAVQNTHIIAQESDELPLVSEIVSPEGFNKAPATVQNGVLMQMPNEAPLFKVPPIPPKRPGRHCQQSLFKIPGVPVQNSGDIPGASGGKSAEGPSRLDGLVEAALKILEDSARGSSEVSSSVQNLDNIAKKPLAPKAPEGHPMVLRSGGIPAASAGKSGEIPSRLDRFVAAGMKILEDSVEGSSEVSSSVQNFGNIAKGAPATSTPQGPPYASPGASSIVDEILERLRKGSNNAQSGEIPAEVASHVPLSREILNTSPHGSGDVDLLDIPDEDLDDVPLAKRIRRISCQDESKVSEIPSSSKIRRISAPGKTSETIHKKFRKLSTVSPQGSASPVRIVNSPAKRYIRGPYKKRKGRVSVKRASKICKKIDTSDEVSTEAPAEEAVFISAWGVPSTLGNSGASTSSAVSLSRENSPNSLDRPHAGTSPSGSGIMGFAGGNWRETPLPAGYRPGTPATPRPLTGPSSTVTSTSASIYTGVPIEVTTQFKTIQALLTQPANPDLYTLKLYS